MISVYMFNAVLVAITITGVWLVSVILKRTDIIDVFWGPGFVLVALLTWLQFAENDAWPVRILVAAVSLWGLRLGVHLLIRWWNEPHEDRRYARMRDAAGHQWPLRSLVTVFWLQATILWLISVPLQSALQDESAFSAPVFVAGLMLWLVGFVFEAVGDWQLSRFRRDSVNQGKVLNTGLWRYTRHPNYFGDCMVWWGLFAMSVALGAAWWTAVSPLVMSALLMKFSGVGMLEKDIADRRPGYADYVARTNTFFPWFPEQTSGH